MCPMNSLPCMQSPNRTQRNNDNDQDPFSPVLTIFLSLCRLGNSPWLELADNFLQTQWWQETLWNSTLKTRKGKEYKYKYKCKYINRTGNGLFFCQRKPGFWTAAEPLFRAKLWTVGHFFFLLRMHVFWTFLKTYMTVVSDIVPVRSQGLPNTCFNLQFIFSLQLQKILN